MGGAECGMAVPSSTPGPRRPLRPPPRYTPHSAFRIPHWGRAGLMGFPHKPHPRETVLLSRYFGEADARTYKGWVKRGGDAALEQARALEPARVIDVVKESGLRGPRGARLPNGVKWSFMPKEKK